MGQLKKQRMWIATSSCRQSSEHLRLGNKNSDAEFKDVPDVIIDLDLTPKHVGGG